MQRHPIIYLAFIFLLSSCMNGSSRKEADVSSVEVPEVVIHRYDQALFDIPVDSLVPGLEAIRHQYAFFLDTDLTDTSRIKALVAYIDHPRTKEFQAATEEAYPNLSALQQQLTEAFRHLRYYDPETEIPNVYTYISGGDYEHPVQFADSVLLIGLDNFLGPDFIPYTADGLPLYKTRIMTREYILPQCVDAMSDPWFPVKYPGNSLLDHMIAAGKRLWFVDAMIPDVPDYLKIGYTPDQMAWALENEELVWSAIIENQLLYSTKGGVVRGFLSDGPFTADFTQASPPRLGAFIGWRIVDAYMDRHPDITLQQLIAMDDAQKILADSHYKPAK